MITKKFDELFDKYKDGDYILERRIKVKLKEIVACYEESDLDAQEFTNDIIDKFCEAIELIEELNDDYVEARFGNDGGVGSTNVQNYLPSNINNFAEPMRYKSGEELLDSFYECFLDKKSVSTMRDYVARVRTFACSQQYLPRLIESGELGINSSDTDPILFTYKNIEQILARFDTKNEKGETVKQKNNIRSALRLLNEFKKLELKK